MKQSKSEGYKEVVRRKEKKRTTSAGRGSNLLEESGPRKHRGRATSRKRGETKYSS